MKKSLQVLLMAVTFSSSAIAENKFLERIPVASFGHTVSNASTSDECTLNEASIRELLELSQSKKIFEQMIAQIDQMMGNSIKELFSNEEFSPENEEKIEIMQAKMAALVKEEMNWERIEAMCLDIYAKAFTQDEIDSMLSFYKSPGGQAVLEKMPVVMQLTFQEVQAKMGQLTQKLQNMQNEIIAELNELE